MTAETEHVTRAMGYNVSRVPCGGGRTFLGVAPNGDLYPCFRFIGINSFRLGNLFKGIDTEATSTFQQGPGRPYEERIPCCNCWAASLCGGPCFSCAEMFGPGDGKPLQVHCAYSLADAKSAVWLMDKFRRRDPERLLSFLPDLKEFTIL